MHFPNDFSALLENTADGVWVSGPDGRIVFWNRAAEAILGYRAAEVVGTPCRVLLAGCDGNGNRICGWPCPVKTLLHQGDLVQHFDMATRNRAGERVWLDVSCITVPGGEGVPTVVHLFRDVTVAHRIEELVRGQLVTEATSGAGEADGVLVGLTPREREIAERLRAGATTAAIAAALFISRATVRNHVQNIFAKLGVHTRLEAVALLNGAGRERGGSAGPPRLHSFRSS